MDIELAQPAVGKARAEPVMTKAIPADAASLWRRITRAYRLFLWAKETSVSVEGVPAQRQRQEALKRWWLDGGDLGS